MAFHWFKKRKLWIWIALDRARFRILDFVTGSREAQTGEKLWNKVKSIDCDRYSSDDLKAYKKFLKQEKHVVSKDETTNIESSNANVRHYLARFRRKTKCYSKSEKMVILSLYLLMYKDSIVSI